MQLTFHCEALDYPVCVTFRADASGIELLSVEAEGSEVPTNEAEDEALLLAAAEHLAEYRAEAAEMRAEYLRERDA